MLRTLTLFAVLAFASTASAQDAPASPASDVPDAAAEAHAVLDAQILKRAAMLEALKALTEGVPADVEAARAKLAALKTAHDDALSPKVIPAP